MRASTLMFALSCVTLAATQPAQEKFKTIVDLRPLLAGSTVNVPGAIHFRDGAKLINVVRVPDEQANAYCVPVDSSGVIGSPTKLNQGTELGSHVISWFDPRGNFYFYSSYDGIWKFNGLPGTRVGTTTLSNARGVATNSLGNLFTTANSVSDQGGSGENNLLINRFSTGLIQNFNYGETSYRTFERMICDKQDNLWVFGVTYWWNHGLLEDTGFVVRKYSPQMTLLFEKTIPNLPAARTEHMAFDTAGFVYMTGWGSGPSVIRKLDPQGNLVWQRPLGGGSGTFGFNRLSVDELGRTTTLVGESDGIHLKQFSAAGHVYRDVLIPGRSHIVDLKRDTYGQFYALTRRLDPNNKMKGVLTKFDSTAVQLFSLDIDTFQEGWDPVSMDVDSKSGDIYTASSQTQGLQMLAAVHGFSQPPVARPDILSVPSATQVSLPVFANDRYVGSFPYQFKITKAPLHGKIITGSTMYYKSDPGYHGPDEFSYRAVRNGLESFPAKVSLTVE